MTELTFARSFDRSLVASAADLVGALVSRGEVEASWSAESSCAGMSVGGLTRHLVGQVTTTVTLLSGEQHIPEGAETLDLLGHYARTPWTSEGPDGPMNTAIRQTSDEQASQGYAEAIRLFEEARNALPAAVAAAPATTYVPWQGWSLATDDFLAVRLMELVVHSDDLATSVGVATPEFGRAVLDPVLRLLATVSLHRHGQDALVRALARPQRATESISAF